jgi:hypothetical protein
MFAQGLGVNEAHESGRFTVIDMVNALALKLSLRHPSATTFPFYAL